MSNTCVICGDGETESPLHRNPCGRHYVCNDDLQGFFRTAIKDESLYPPDCCRVPFLLMDYEEVLPYDLLFEYQSKEQGEYAVQKKFRVYCANPSCAKFLRPDSHITDPDSNVTYAMCDEENCGKTSCIKCRTVLLNGTAGHVCEVAEVDKQFIDTANRERYQQCYACGETIELTEACNHISCGCGNDFCYVCGKPWSGLHGCPQYGPAEYDEEGYNQDGYHRDTGLNRDGLTRLEFNRQGREEDEEEQEEADQFQLPPWVAPEFRDVFNVLSPEDQIEALELHRIEMGIFDEEEPDGDENDDGDEGDGEDEDGEEVEVEEVEAEEVEAEEVEAEEVEDAQEVEVDGDIPVTHVIDGLREGEEEGFGQPDVHETSSFDPTSPTSQVSASQYPLPLSRPESSAFSHGATEDDNFSGPSSPSAPESSAPDTDLDIVPMDIDQEETKLPTHAPYVWTDEEL